MRVISGIARGTKLYTLNGEITRPTLDRVKESVFNIIQNEIKDSTFLDLFAGSGAISIEAASRGAKKVVACDKSKEAVNIIKKNIEKTHMEEKIIVYNLDFVKCIENLKNIKFDLVYLDPPYKTNYAIKAIKHLIKNNLINNDSKIIIETDDEKVLETIEKENIQIIDKRKYGRAIITFIKNS